MTESIKRRRMRPDLAPRPAVDILHDLDCETVILEGREISMLEAGILLLYSRSLKGDIGASVDLQRIRDRVRAEIAPRPPGVLVVPGPISLEEFKRRAYEQQSQFREQRCPEDEP